MQFQRYTSIRERDGFHRIRRMRRVFDSVSVIRQNSGWNPTNDISQYCYAMHRETAQVMSSYDGLTCPRGDNTLYLASSR